MNKINEKLSDMITLASSYHKEQTRWDGITPYIIHPIEVMLEILAEYPEDLELAQIAILHDILEDTEMTMLELKKLVSLRVLQGVLFLTKKKKQPYDDYIFHILRNKDAIRVKLADIKVNNRMDKQVGTNKSYEDQGKRWAKYKKSYDLLIKKLKEGIK